MSILLGRKTYPIGLDLGTQCIKMLQLEPTQGSIHVVAAGQYTFPVELDGNSPERAEMAIQAVKKLLKQNPFRGRKVISALPDSEVTVKVVRLSQLSSAQVEQAIWFAAAEKLPFDIQSAQLQYIPAGHIQQGDDIRNEMIVLAARNQDVLDHIGLLSAMSLEPVAIDAGPCALFRGFERFLLRGEDEKEVSFIIDIGAATTKVVIGHGAEVAFVKIIKLGSQDLTAAVADCLGISIADAIKIHRSTGICSNPDENEATDAAEKEVAREVFNASRAVLSELGREISMCLRYHGVMFRGYRPTAVRLTGGEAHSKSTADFLSKALALPVQSGDPFRYTDTSKVDLNGNRRKPAPSWAVSAGLALRGLIKTKNATGDAA